MELVASEMRRMLTSVGVINLATCMWVMLSLEREGE